MDPQAPESLLIGIKLPHLGEVWEEAWRLLEPAVTISNGRLTAKLIADALLSKDMQLWVVPNGENLRAAVLTEILTYATGLKVCRILACGGKDLESWMDITVEILSAWAESLECKSLELYGRPGWERKLKGWGKPFICLERPLNGGNNG